MSYQQTPLELGKWYVSDNGPITRLGPGDTIKQSNLGRHWMRVGGPFDGQEFAERAKAKYIDNDSNLRGRLSVWNHGQPRDHRRLELEGMSDEEFLPIYEAALGGAPARRDRAVQSLLGYEYGAPTPRQVSLPCPRCKTEMPHRTPGTTRDTDGQRVQAMQCAVCETWNIVPTGEHGEKFQANVDTPDETDFSDVD